MKLSFKILSIIALLLIIIPVFFVFKGSINVVSYKNLIFAGTIGWFINAPFWIYKKYNLKDE